MWCMPLQVLALPWVLTEGGAVARPLGVEVTKGAANTAALRRYAAGFTSFCNSPPHIAPHC